MQFDAIIILANLMDARGNLNAESRARMDLAVEAYHRKEALVLVTCGWAYREDSTLPIAHAMADYAINYHNIPPVDILVEANSRDTVGDAVFTKRSFAKPRQWARLLVCTSDYHAARTKEIFAFIFGNDLLVDVTGAPTHRSEETRDSERASREAFHSTFREIVPGDDEAIMCRLCERHPFYNGTVYPKIV